MELRHLRYFATVAEEGSFHRAAERLHIAQPALSRRIRDLEEELDVVLFFRSARGVKLSPAGEVLRAEVERLLPQVELAKSRTRQAARGKFGSVRVAMTTAVAELRFAIAAVAEARRLMPEVEFHMSLIPSDQQLKALDNGDIDIGLLYRRPPEPSDLICRDLRVDRYVVVVPETHWLAERRSVRLPELQGEDMMFPSPAYRPATYREMMALCRRGGLEPRVVFEAEGLFSVVSEGLAIALYNSAMARGGNLQGVRFVEIEDLDVPLRMAAMWRRERETPALLGFVDLLVRETEAEINGANKQ